MRDTHCPHSSVNDMNCSTITFKSNSIIHLTARVFSKSGCTLTSDSKERLFFNNLHGKNLI